MTILFLINAVVALNTFLLVKNIFSKRFNPDFILAWFTLFFSQIIIVELFWGIAGKLYLPNIALTHSLIFLVNIFFFRGKNALEYRVDCRFLLENKILLLAIAVFAGFLFLKLWQNLINPPICPESHQYHLSFPATWLRSGNLENPLVVFGSRPLSAELTALTYYPMNAELFLFWLMLPLRNAFLADLGLFVFYLIGILAIYSILRKYTLPQATALLMGLLWALIPNVLKQIKMGTQVDVMCAALLVLVLNHIIILKNDFRYRNAIILGLAWGIFLGTKALNIFWSLALLPLFVYFIHNNLRKNKLGQTASILAIIFFGILLLGSFTYIRTFLLTGNPFYPVKLVLLGKTVFPGIIDKAVFSQIFVRWEEFSLRNMFFSEGLGLQFLAFIFPGTIIPLIAFPFFRRRNEPLTENMLFFAMAPIMLAMYLFYIKAYWIRYFFPYLGIGLISAAIFLNRFGWGRKYITIVGFICIFSSAAELAHRRDLVISLLISSGIFFSILIMRQKIKTCLPYILNFKNIILLSLVSYAFLYFLNGKYDREEYGRYPELFHQNESGEEDIGLAWQWLDKNTGEEKRIAYTGRSEFYPLFGTGIKNDVYYVSVNNKPSLPHYYPDGLYRKDKIFIDWKNNLNQGRVDYLFVALPYPINNESENIEEFPIEDKWARENPGLFRLVFSNTKARIYSIVK